jgi:hypothetical protein
VDLRRHPQRPSFNYAFLATTSAGDLLAGTYNRSDAPRELPAILIRNPTSPNPQVQELCRVPHVGAFSKSGEQVGELAHPIDLAKLAQLM